MASLKIDDSSPVAMPRIGIVVLDSQLRAALRARVEAQGLSVMHCSGLAWDCAVRMAYTDVDAWITEDSDRQLAPSLPSGQQSLVTNIEARGLAGSLSWCEMVDRKLQKLVQKYQKICEANCARHVWLLAASAGGLQAVRAFLEGLDAFYGVAFIYAQHIEAEQANQLVKMIARNTPWDAQMALDGNRLTTGTVSVVCPAQRVVFSSGLVSNARFSWTGSYAPNIDDVAAELANEYGPACGMIVFSGMGDDGVVGSRLIREKGGTVLVQSPADCTVSALPEAVIKGGAFDASGDIDQLRAGFIKLLSTSLAKPNLIPQGVLSGRE